MFWLTDPDTNDPGLLPRPDPVEAGCARAPSAFDQLDPADPPRITLPDVREPSDLERLAEGYRLAIEIANRPEIRSLCSEPAPDGT